MAQTTATRSPPCSPPVPRPKRLGTTTPSTHPVHKTLACAANLANLLPTGTVLAFRTLMPSFSNKGVCETSNKCLTASLILFCATACFLSSFTDSFIDGADQGKLYYGIATFKGFYVFNRDDKDHEDEGDQLVLETEEKKDNTVDLSKFKLSLIDFVHAFVSLFVFLVFAFSESDVQNCLLVGFRGANVDELAMNLPLAAGAFSSFLFMIFPSTRRGIGYADLPNYVSK
ncbi:protein DMP10-like [Primulina tabacum]|uniref:protein DMP10-like n=1 Tax=Primulina tabacum TaxID=48773 RepID=UPI003F5A7E22